MPDPAPSRDQGIPVHPGARPPDPADRDQGIPVHPGSRRPERPLIALPARFSASASALRYGADVTSRKLAEAVFAAGGEPLMLHPHAPGAIPDPDAVRVRFPIVDGVLLPGGGDLAGHWSGQPEDPSLYDVDEEQDAFDLALARVALDDRLPLLAVCRGTQVVNVALGGTLVQDMAATVGNHRHRVHEIEVKPDSPLGAITGHRATISCYHHQCIDRLGDGLVAVAHAADGVIEAVSRDAAGWFLGVQWHPEDSADTDPVQAAVFRSFVEAASGAERHSGRTDDLNQPRRTRSGPPILPL